MFRGSQAFYVVVEIEIKVFMTFGELLGVFLGRPTTLGDHQDLVGLLAFPLNKDLWVHMTAFMLSSFTVRKTSKVSNSLIYEI